MFREFFRGGSWFDLPLIAMVLFLAIFLTVIVRVFQRARRSEYDRMAAMPLDDGVEGERAVAQEAHKS